VTRHHIFDHCQKKSFRLQHCFVHIVIANAFISCLARLRWLSDTCIGGRHFLSLCYFLSFLFLCLSLPVLIVRGNVLTEYKSGCSVQRSTSAMGSGVQLEER